MAEYNSVQIECTDWDNVHEFYEHIEFWCIQNNIEATATGFLGNCILFRVNTLHEAIFKLKWS